MNYWEECISEAFDDVGIKATKDQIENVAAWVEGAHENYGMAHGYDVIPNPREKEKTICPDCKGKGREITYGPYHSGESDCFKCSGKGFLYPN